MSGPKDCPGDQDPDYEAPGPSDEAHQKFYEETARTNVARKITAIVEKEFSKEIDTKEKEILQIEGRLHKALKTLHFLRYVIITDFYNRKQCQAVPPPGESKQTRIHPAIRQIIGKAPRDAEDIIQLTSAVDPAIPSTSKNCTFVDLKQESTSKSEICLDPREIKKTGKIRKRSDGDEETPGDSIAGPPRKIPRYVPPKSGVPEPAVPSRGARHKVRKRIVVGNISKWIPPDWREDAASHKWTMYVRGSKENADITDFVGKVRFFLHPSYRPNDVVEVTSPPFHLSRRGWGEFPLRVQLHFKNPLNKPMDIIHHLKLDRTYTGLQTLGSETVVDVWIKTCPEISTCDSENSRDLSRIIKKEPQENLESSALNLPPETIKQEPEVFEESTSHVHFEHDYANLSGNREKNTTIEHSPPRNSNGNGEAAPKSSENCENTNEYCGIDTNMPASVDVKTMASGLENSSTKLQPLTIAIPASFDALTRTKNTNSKTPKQILVLKDGNKLIPVESLGLKSNTGLTVKTGGVIGKGVSLLKKPPGNSIGTKDGKILLKFNPNNSLMLNSASDIPALKFAEPLGTNSPANSRIICLVGVNGSGKNTVGASEENCKVVGKPKITLGKDKIGASCKKKHYEEILRSIDEARITDVSGLVRFILRRLPLVTEKATDPDYRSLHPYACESEREFLDHNVGKQRAFEWYRAKSVRSFLKKKRIPESEQWTVKEIMIWSRLHGYTPFRSLPTAIAQRSCLSTAEKSSDKNPPGNPGDSASSLCTFTEPAELLEYIRIARDTKAPSGDSEKYREDEDTEFIDVETVEDPIKEKKLKRLNGERKENGEIGTVSLGIPENIVGLQTFVCETARQIGVKLEPEEIVPGVTHCASARMMVRAVQCLIEDLLRSSHAMAWERRNDTGSPDTITLEDVRSAILNREEFDVFTNEGLGSHHCSDD